MSLARLKKAMSGLPIFARIGAEIAIVWILLLCVLPISISMHFVPGSGFASAMYGGALLASREDRRGQRMAFVFAFVSLTHMGWVMYAAGPLFWALAAVNVSLGDGDLWVPMTVATALVYGIMILIANRDWRTVVPLMLCAAISSALSTLPAESTGESRGLVFAVAILHAGVASSLLWGVMVAQARGSRIGPRTVPEVDLVQQ